MGLVRCLARWMCVVAVLCGVFATLGGCGRSSQPGGVPGEIDVKEQTYLQERIQKGISKSPIKPSR